MEYKNNSQEKEYIVIPHKPKKAKPGSRFYKTHRRLTHFEKYLWNIPKEDLKKEIFVKRKHKPNGSSTPHKFIYNTKIYTNDPYYFTQYTKSRRKKKNNSKRNNTKNKTTTQKIRQHI